MTAPERAQLRRSLIVGAAITVVVAGLQAVGGFRRADNFAYDLKARWCQGRAEGVTDHLVHYDIDDPALTAIGGWPWPRQVVADMVGELDAAGAKAIGLDILFTDRRRPLAYKPPDDSEDKALAEAIAKCGRVVSAASFGFEPQPPSSRPTGPLIEQLKRFPQLDFDGAKVEMRRAGQPPPTEEQFESARREAMFNRIDERPVLPPLDELQSDVLGPQTTITTPYLIFEKQYRRVEALRALAPRCYPLTVKGGPPPLNAESELPPLPEISKASAACGCVDFLPSGDGIVRSVPLWIDDRGQGVPQLGFALACLYKGIPAGPPLIEKDRVVINAAAAGGATIVIPTHAVYSRSLGRAVGALVDVPLWGTDDWRSMYSQPQHRPILEIWGILDIRRQLRHNNEEVARALHVIYPTMGEDAGKDFFAHAPGVEDSAAWLAAAQKVLGESNIVRSLESYDNMSDAEKIRVDPGDRAVIVASKALKNVVAVDRRLLGELRDRRKTVHDVVKDKAVLVGSTATATPDFWPTSLHAQCPGVVIHGAVFNAIITGHYWRRLPDGWGVVFAVMLGLGATAASAWLPPRLSLPVTVGLVAVWLLLNGPMLFGRWRLMAPAAAPAAVVVLVWPVLTRMRLRFETVERDRMIEKFRYYVDPALVDYLIDHPEQVRFQGQVREITVAVTDLAGFTSITESLREKAVELLNQYMDRMVPVIRRHGGYVNKFLGDGIMFFFGAPVERRDHAPTAVDAVLAMQREMVEFNRDQQRDNQPPLGMRAAISSGLMVVGDAGASTGSDYTVLGDAVNLCFRLEAANKTFGSAALLTEATARLLGERFLLRPIARIRVAGRTRAVMTYEALCRLELATDDQRRVVELTHDVVDRFVAADFPGCLEAVATLEAECGRGRFTAAYGDACREHLAQPPAEFDGSFSLGK